MTTPTLSAASAAGHGCIMLDVWMESLLMQRSGRIISIVTEGILELTQRMSTNNKLLTS